jgi:hypothetical protein
VLSGGGGLFVQPERIVDGRRLDDVVGSRFLVLTRSVQAYGHSAERWRGEFGALVATTGPGARGALAPWVEELDAWMQRRGCEVVVVRPDRYVLGTASNLDELTPAVAGLLGGPKVPVIS